jgi:hypothetical protein
MGDCPANEDNSVLAKGCFVTDAFLNYFKRNMKSGLVFKTSLT